MLPDGLAGEIIRTTFIPRFRENDYGTGIVLGTRRVVDIVRRNEEVNEDQRAALERASGAIPSDWFIVPFLGLFVGLGALFAGLGIGSRTWFAVMFGTIFGGVGLFLGLILATRPGVGILLGIGGVAVLAGYFLGLTDGARKSLRGPTTKGRWIWGSGGDGGGRGGSSGFGGGSSRSSGGGFGGGRSGGGGASGRW